METGSYIAIDLKTFYASVECADRGLDPFTTNLVVADPARGSGTICLAITPAMKALGIRNRCRVHEIPPNVEFIEVRPRMRRYMEVSAEIYAIYLRRFSEQDIHVYSVDECFIDVAPYLALYSATPRELAIALMDDVYREKHICATAGIGTNLFLAKVALDLISKHASDHIGELDRASFMERIWHHRPITDIWGIGPGIARRLERYGAHDLAGVTRIDQALLRREFGINADRLIDHAWGREPCTMADVKSYVPEAHSISNGQVLMRDYQAREARVVMREMVDASALDLVSRRLACTGVALWCSHSWNDLDEPGGWQATRSLPAPTDSRRALHEAIDELWETHVDERRAVRRLGIALTGLTDEKGSQPTLFDDPDALAAERSLGRCEAAIKGRFGRNALIRGVSLRPEATGMQRNAQVGGHHE